MLLIGSRAARGAWIEINNYFWQLCDQIAEKLGRSAARFSDAQLRQSFLDIADADYAMKTGRGGNELLEHIVIELCA